MDFASIKKILPKLFFALVFFISAESLSYGQGRNLLPVGGEAKAYSGAGQIKTRGAFALAYNPANITRSANHEIQYDLSYLSLNYKYEYPGYDAVKINKSTPIPFVGYSQAVLKNLYVGGYFLPLPASSQKTVVEGVPTRKVGSSPIVVQVEQDGKGFGYNGAFGAGYRLFPYLSIGLAIEAEKSGIRRQVFSRDLAGFRIKLQDTELETSTKRFRTGIRYVLNRNFKFGASAILWAETKAEGSEKTLLSFGDGSESLDKTTSGPNSVAAAGEAKIGSFGVIMDLNYTLWKATQSEEEADLFNTLDYVLSGVYTLNRSQEANVSYGFYPSYKGDGLIAARSPSDEEVSGLEVGDVAGFSRHVTSAGYTFIPGAQRFTAYVNYQSGSRDVFEDGVSYGKHEITVIQLGLSGRYKF